MTSTLLLRQLKTDTEPVGFDELYLFDLILGPESVCDGSVDKTSFLFAFVPSKNSFKTFPNSPQNVALRYRANWATSECFRIDFGVVRIEQFHQL